MERHVYKFEFKYDRQVNGKKVEFTVPVIVHNECYVDACTKVDEFVRKNFADRVTEESTIKYVGEFVHGVLKPFVEVKEETDVKMIDNMNIKKSKVERDQALKENETLKKRVKYLIERNNRFEVNEKYYDEEYRKLSDEKKTHEGVINWYKKEFGRLNLIIADMENRLEKEDVDVCKVYQIERDQALKENEVLQERIDWISADSEKVYENLRFTGMVNDRLLVEVSGYKKELFQLNLLMDDMENRLEKQVIAREGMLKQLREYKAEKKRMNKIIDALTEDK